MKVSRGLYRNFTGVYYFVDRIVEDVNSTNMYVVFFDVCNPSSGEKTCILEEFTREVAKDGSDFFINVTGQTYCNERVDSIHNPVSSFTTPQLIRELITRKDSPIYGLDIEGAESRVLCKDFVCGYPMVSPNQQIYLPQVIPFDTQEEAEKYSQTHANATMKRPQVFKRIIIEV